MRLPGTPYELIRALGAGGIGEVHEAVHVELGARRAIKLLRRELSGQREVRARFTREARILAQLRHPNLVEVLDLGVSSDGRPYLAMELLEGRTLRDVLLDRERLRADQAVSIAAAVLDALEVVHAHGVVHRDVKPENVFVLAGRGVKLLDFGIARIASLAELTATGASLGTPRYMAPEQARGEAADARADLWAVGALVWEMTGGAPPHAEVDGVLAAARVAREGLPRGDFEPDALAEIVHRATRPDPRARPQTAAALRAALVEAVGGEPDEASTIAFDAEPTALLDAALPPALSLEAPAAAANPTPDAPAPPGRPRRAWPVIAASASLAFAAVVAMAALVVRPRSRAPLASASSARAPSGAPSAEVAPIASLQPLPPASSFGASSSATTARPSPRRPRPPPARPLPPDDLPPSGL